MKLRLGQDHSVKKLLHDSVFVILVLFSYLSTFSFSLLVDSCLCGLGVACVLMRY
jgi:hypothetical protein